MQFDAHPDRGGPFEFVAQPPPCGMSPAEGSLAPRRTGEAGGSIAQGKTVLRITVHKEKVVESKTLLSEIGVALWGSDWQQQLDRTLGQRPGTFADWESGRAQVPAAVWKELREAVRQRALELADLDPRIVASYDAAYQRELKKRP
ncbi:MAG: hypothetical protein JOY64_31720 [Alphaproteobacteria bacterium]|nr:hypothetical protein [Alphaproteobacteria bacterium]MBV8412228.1 hypothetical protein [Alphaproteobacteria bacterium]